MATHNQPPKDEGSSPDAISVAGGGGVSRDRLYDILQRVSSIESSMTFLVAAVDDSKTKIESISKDVADAKAKFDVIKSLLTGASKGIWAIVLLLTTFGLSVLGMWLKHHFNW